MVGEPMMIAMAIDPAHRIYVDADRVVEDHHRLDEPHLVVQGAVRDPHMSHIRQINAGQEPDEEDVQDPDARTFPWAESFGGE
jgi:hypothetical protein